MGRLAADERLVVGVRPHGRALIGPVVVLLVLAPGAIVVAGSLPSGRFAGLLRTLVLGTSAVLLWRATVVPFLQWFRTLYAVTDQRIVSRRGVLRRSGRDVPIDRVVEVDVWQGRWDRMLGCGRVRVVAEGERTSLVLMNVRAVDHVVGVMRRYAGLVPFDDGELPGMYDEIDEAVDGGGVGAIGTLLGDAGPQDGEEDAGPEDGEGDVEPEGWEGDAGPEGGEGDAGPEDREDDLGPNGDESDVSRSDGREGTRWWGWRWR